jgi:hypothetical protein
MSADPRIHRIFRVAEHWCVVGDNGLAFYVGYVSVPEGHPWHGQGYDEIMERWPVEAHGGLTFSDFRDWEGWQGAVDGTPPGWYVGMDFGHYCDMPIPGSYMADHWPRFSQALGGHEWDVESVAGEVRRLAVSAQVSAAAVMLSQPPKWPPS